MLAKGTLVAGRYRVLCEVGGNSALFEYDAEDIETSALVALKTVRDISPLRDDEIHRLAKEEAVLKTVDHPGIVAIHQVLTYEGTPVLLVERARGERLYLRVDRFAIGGPSEVIHIAAQVLGALGYAHRKGLVHRDVRPGTILCQVGEGGRTNYRLLHLGVSTLLQAFKGSYATTGGAVRRYASPELLRGGVVDGRSDLYSLGAALWACLYGTAPFAECQTEASILEAMKSMKSLTVNRRGTPLPLVKFIEKLTAIDPDKRYQSADEALAVLELKLMPIAQAMQQEHEGGFDPIDSAATSIRRLFGKVDDSDSPVSKKTGIAWILAIILGIFGLFYFASA